MNLSLHFTLEEFLRSDVAARNGIDMTPPDWVVVNLRELCIGVLEPLRAKVGPISISSGYRPPRLNALIGGAKDSAHQYGVAADVESSAVSPLELCVIAQKMGLPIDQVIHEFGQWAHFSIERVGWNPRNEFLTAVKGPKPLIGKPKTIYLPGLLTMEAAQAKIA